MNEQIKKLFEAAGANENTLAVLKRTTYFDPERFAELIVRECAKRSAELGNTELGQGLLNHFGVDENS